MSQSELARRVKLTQPAINALIRGSSRTSLHLHRIAQVLQTSTAYLEGESDDPDENAPPPPAPTEPRVLLEVVMPPEDVLAAMFEGLLAVVDMDAPPSELARELAQLLPTALSQVRGRATDRPALSPRRRAAAPAALATADHERQR